MQTKVIRSVIVIILIAAYSVLALCDFVDGRYRTGIVSALFAAVTWLIFI